MKQADQTTEDKEIHGQHEIHLTQKCTNVYKLGTLVLHIDATKLCFNGISFFQATEKLVPGTQSSRITQVFNKYATLFLLTASDNLALAFKSEHPQLTFDMAHDQGQFLLH